MRRSLSVFIATICVAVLMVLGGSTEAQVPCVNAPCEAPHPDDNRCDVSVSTPSLTGHVHTHFFFWHQFWMHYSATGSNSCEKGTFYIDIDVGVYPAQPGTVSRGTHWCDFCSSVTTSATGGEAYYVEDKQNCYTAVAKGENVGGTQRTPTALRLTCI